MDNSSVLVIGGNQVNQEQPPPRVCPRCDSTNTKFCYYNNYKVSQPRYRCKDCRRHWTHGGELRNIPIGGSGHKNKSTRIDQPSDSQVVSAAVQQVSRRHQPFLHAHETNQFGGSSSSGIPFGNQIGSFPEIHGHVMHPFQSFPPMYRSDFHDGLFQRDYYNVESNGLIGSRLNNQSIGNRLINQSIGNPLINQSIGSYNALSSDHNSYINQDDQNKWNHQGFSNTMNMNHNANTSGSREYSDIDHMNKNNCVYKSSYHLEEHGL